MQLVPVEILNTVLGAGLLGVTLSAMYVPHIHHPRLVNRSDNFIRVYGITCAQTLELKTTTTEKK